MASDRYVYKVVSGQEWRRACSAGSYTGSADDLRDGYIHFSTKCQVRETLKRHFAGQAGLLIIAFDCLQFGNNLRWEPSRGGKLFPHLYGTLHTDLALWALPLAIAQDGTHRLPESLTGC